MPEYIEKTAVINALIDVENRYNRNRDHENVSAEALYKDLCDAEGKIGKTPAADVAPVVHGRWCGESDGYADGYPVTDVWYCSECDHCIDDGTDTQELLPNYCPHCGAKMDL